MKVSEGDIEKRLRKVLDQFLAKEKHEAWIDNIAHDVEMRLSNKSGVHSSVAGVAAAKVAALLRQGFAGWSVPLGDDGHPATLGYRADEGVVKRTRNSVIRHVDAPNYAMAERGTVLGARKGE